MYVNTADSLNELVLDALRETCPNGCAKDVTIGSKNLFTRELHPALLCLTNPLKRILSLKERKADIRATVGEMIWVLSGTKEIRTLLPYLPRAIDFSDDGKVWRAGYGERILNYKSFPDSVPINQFEYVKNTLKHDLSSRQAIISLWDPNRDPDAFYKGGSKDYPCCNHVQFLVRDNKIDCTLTIRSNDILWGFSHINCFEFTVFQELLAMELNVDLGNYYHHACSLHLYERHFERRDKILEANNNITEYPIQPKFESTDLSFFINHINNPSDNTIERLILKYKSFPRVPPTEFFWMICLLFAWPSLREGKKNGFNLINRYNLAHEFKVYFCCSSYGEALAYTLGFNSSAEMLKEFTV